MTIARPVLLALLVAACGSKTNGKAGVHETAASAAQKAPDTVTSKIDAIFAKESAILADSGILDKIPPHAREVLVVASLTKAMETIDLANWTPEEKQAGSTFLRDRVCLDLLDKDALAAMGIASDEPMAFYRSDDPSEEAQALVVTLRPHSESKAGLAEHLAKSERTVLVDQSTHATIVCGYNLNKESLREDLSNTLGIRQIASLEHKFGRDLLYVREATEHETSFVASATVHDDFLAFNAKLLGDDKQSWFKTDGKEVPEHPLAAELAAKGSTGGLMVLDFTSLGMPSEGGRWEATQVARNTGAFAPNNGRFHGAKGQKLLAKMADKWGELFVLEGELGRNAQKYSDGFLQGLGRVVALRAGVDGVRGAIFPASPWKELGKQLAGYALIQSSAEGQKIATLKAEIAALSGRIERLPITGGEFASLTGTGDFSAGLEDRDNVIGALVGNEVEDMQWSFGLGPGGGGRSGLGDVGASGYGNVGASKGTKRSASVRIGNATTTGDLDKNIIRRYIRRKLPMIHYCYERGLLVKPTLKGTSVAQFQISPSGAVKGASATGMGKELDTCVARVIREIQFPKPKDGGKVQVRFQFTFTAGQG